MDAILTLVGQGGEQFRDGLVQLGVPECRCDLRQRSQHKAAVRQRWMRNPQTRLIENAGAKQKEVEVESARSVARALPSITAEPLLDREELLEQDLWLKHGLERDRRVQEHRLIAKADRLRLVERRSGTNSSASGKRVHSSRDGLRRAAMLRRQV